MRSHTALRSRSGARGEGTARVLPSASPRQVSIARVPGRVVLDGIATLKSATHRFDRFTLDHVASELLGRGKKIAKGVDALAEIRRMYAEDVDALAAYNLEDSRLVLDIFDHADLVGFAMERARLTGLPMDRQGGSVAAFDYLYLPRLHRHGFVAPDVGYDVDVVASPGGHVLDSVPGHYRDVLSFDFRSLYPSIIRTFRIDPLGLFQPGENPLPGEDGATFARDPERTILPALIETLHEARSRAMADNEALSRAIKILMNSFYGVLGTPGCRFFDSRLPTSITRKRGNAVIERARAFLRRTRAAGSVRRHRLALRAPRGGARRGRRSRTGPGPRRRAHARARRRDPSRARRGESPRAPARIALPEVSHADHARHRPRVEEALRGPRAQRTAGSPRLVVRGLEAVRTDWT